MNHERNTTRYISSSLMSNIGPKTRKASSAGETIGAVTLLNSVNDAATKASASAHSERMKAISIIAKGASITLVATSVRSSVGYQVFIAAAMNTPMRKKAAISRKWSMTW